MANTDSTAVSRKTIEQDAGSVKDTIPSLLLPADVEISSNDDHSLRRVIQNFFLIWVDSCINESRKDYEDIITELRRIVNTIYTYTSIKSCIDLLTKIGNEKFFLIVSESLSKKLVPLIHHTPQLDTIYIFRDKKTILEEYTDEWSKVKGVYSQITSICEALEHDVEQCNRNSIPISFIPCIDGTINPDLNQLDPSFMYTQLFKEILLKNQYDHNSIEDLVAFWRQQYDGNHSVLNTILEFKQSYNRQSSIWWYTRYCFTYEILNGALRNLEADNIIKMGFLIKDLHRQIEQLHSEQFGKHQKEPFTIYRGQGLSESDFENLMKTKGGLISFNSFLSTSRDRSVALQLAESNSGKMSTIGILFEMVINPSIFLSPFADIRRVSHFACEKEVLFSMHTVFRICEIRQIEDNTRVWEVKLELTDDKDHQLSTLTDQIRQETLGSTGYERLGKLLVKIGQSKKAEELYQALLSQTTNEHMKFVFYQQIGDIRDGRGDYANALSYYEKAREIMQAIPSSDQSQLGTIYMNIGAVYMKMNEHSKATLSIEEGVELLQRDSLSNHPDLIISYVDIGESDNRMRRYSEALFYQNKALEISEKTFPPNQLHLATSYNNIGVIYHNMGEYVQALSFYEKAYEIFEQVLPSIHPSLSTSYNNIGAVHKNMAEYSKALSFYEKSLAIREKTLSPTHPDLAISYTNIGMLYDRMGESSKALEYLERAIDIFSRSLPTGHPYLQALRNTSVQIITQIQSL